MTENRRRDTKPEMAVRRAVHALGLRYRVDAEPLPIEDEDEVGAEEGAALYRKHRRLERDRTLVRKKQNRVLSDTGRLAWERLRVLGNVRHR